MPMVKYRECKRHIIVCMAFLIALIAGKAQAEYFGLNNGRLGNSGNPGSLSVELGLVTGKLVDLDYDNPTLRINYQLKEEIQLFADLSKASVGELDENAFGLGAFYSLGKLFSFSENVTFKGSIHKARLYKYNNGRLTPYCTGPTPVTNPFDGSLTIDPGYCSSTLSPGSSNAESIQVFSFELLFGGKPIEALQFNSQHPSWYLNVGVNSFRGNNIGSEFGAGGGLVLPLDQGELYAGVDIINELLFGVGFRYAVK